jgi:hypothetical protein
VGGHAGLLRNLGDGVGRLLEGDRAHDNHPKTSGAL